MIWANEYNSMIQSINVKVKLDNEISESMKSLIFSA